MIIYTVACIEGCLPMHFTARHRAEAAKTTHYIAKGHAAALLSSSVDVNA